ncbi:MAG: response regulator transcription factor [Anaerolineae bacterium]
MTTILLVEDEMNLAQVLISEFEREGYTVIHASDGLRALELHASERPDLIVLDWMLPKLVGVEVVRQIRESAATPIILLTALSNEPDRITGLEAGADDYITKPFSNLELIARVKALFRRVELIRQIVETDKEAAALQTISQKGLVLDTETYSATLLGTPLNLTQTEFDLLFLFMRYPGRTFNRRYLLDKIWGVDHVGGDRSVDSAILRLRKKLSPLGDVIETVWSVGYRWTQ